MIRKPFVAISALVAALCVAACTDSATKPLMTGPGLGTAPVAGSLSPTTPPPVTSGTVAGRSGVAGSSSTPSVVQAPPNTMPANLPAGGMAQGSGGMTSSEPSAGAGAGAPATPSSAPATGNCEGGSLMPGDTNMSVEVAGTNRTFILHVPPMYDGKKPLPLMMNFHSLMSTASAQRSNSGYAQLGDTEGFVSAFLQGIGNQWDLGKLTRPGNDEHDRMFAVAVLDMISKAGCIDTKRVYASGYSMGGGLTHYLGCREGAKFAAIAPSAFDLIQENQPCEPGRPMTVIMFRGRMDPVVAWEPSTGTLTGAPATFLGAEGCFKEWARIDGCTDQPKDIGNKCQKYSQCMGGVEVTLCENGAHTPGDARISWDAVKNFSLP